MATMAATEAESISTIWLEPNKESSPKIKTLMDIRLVRNITGINALNRVGRLVVFVIKVGWLADTVFQIFKTRRKVKSFFSI